MKKFFSLSLMLVSLCLFSVGCEPSDTPATGDGAADGEHDHEHAEGEEDHDHDEEEGVEG